MELNVEFDESRMVARTGKTQSFIIYWTHDEDVYPDALWPDFGAVLISLWLMACGKLRDGSVAETFIFMEGSCKLDVARVMSDVCITAPDDIFTWNVPLEALISELLRVGGLVCDEFIKLGIGGADLAGLQRAMEDHKRYRERDLED